MFVLELTCNDPDRELLSSDLWDRGTTGIVETSDGLRAFFEDDARIPQFLAEFARFAPLTAPVMDEDWIGYARAQTHPMLIGEKLFLAPEWRDDPTPEGRLRIGINPGLAFGTGSHETTRMCLEWLEANIKPGITVCDIGTGSGILSETAALLGANQGSGRVIACDIDPVAVGIARANIRRAASNPVVYTGSVTAIAPGIVDLLLANISPDWISALAKEWVRVLRPGGHGFLSGFDELDLPQVHAALRKAGLQILATRGENAWRAIEIARE